jgi:hypothetical protein
MKNGMVLSLNRERERERERKREREKERERERDAWIAPGYARDNLMYSVGCRLLGSRIMLSVS